MTTMEKTTPARPWSDLDRASVRNAAWCVVLAALISVGGYLRIPIPGNPVPLTLQVVFVLLAGATLTPLSAAGSVTLFIAAGLAGAPVFAGGGAGLAYLTGPTGGYLVGFIAGAALCSRIIAGRRESIARVVLGMSACVVATYACGASQLALYLGVGPAAAIQYGVIPFLSVDVLKIAFSAAVLTGASSLFSGSAARGF